MVLLVGREVDYVEFMSVRKIPLKERPRFAQDGSAKMDDDMDTEDPEVQTAMQQIRQKVLTDRALHDKVRFVHSAAMITANPRAVGCKSLRVLRSCILEARSLVHFPLERPRSSRSCEKLWAATVTTDA